MRITLGELRAIVRQVVLETGGGTTIPSRPVTRDPYSPSMSDREQIGRISVKDVEDPDEIAPHLREPEFEPEECWGPVPPVAPDPGVTMDPWTTDWHVIPTKQIRR